MSNDHTGSAASAPHKPRRLIPIWWWVVVTIGVVASLVAGQFDQAMSYILLFAVSMIGALALMVRYLRFGRQTLRVRILPLIVFFGGIAAAASCLRIDDMTGNLVPTRVTPRWLPKRDQLLELPVAATASPSVSADLLTVTENDFPQFLGPHRNAAIETMPLETDWRQRKPRLVWRNEEFGAGWSAFSAVNGFAVTMEQRGENELVTCYDIKTGDLVWSHAIKARHETVPGGVGPRATPTIDQGKVYALGATGVLRCLDGASGNELWRRDLLAEVGLTPDEDMKSVAWGRAASPLVDGQRVIVPIGGPSGPTVAALDKDTGEILWKQGERQVSYASPALATLDDVRQIVMVCEDWVCGHDAETGELLWEYEWAGKANTNPSTSQPVPAGDDRVFLSKGYALGSALIRVKRNGAGEWNVEELWRLKNVMKTKMTNAVIYKDHVYGLDDSILSCVELDTGRRKWKRGRYGHGQILRVGDVLLVQAQSGDIALVELNPDRFKELASMPAIEGKTWNNPCLYGSYLLVRNAEQAACYEMPLLEE